MDFLQFLRRLELCLGSLQILPRLKTSSTALQIGILVSEKQFLLCLLMPYLTDALNWSQGILSLKTLGKN